MLSCKANVNFLSVHSKTDPESVSSIHKKYLPNRKEFQLQIYRKNVEILAFSNTLEGESLMRRNEMFEVSRQNAEWLKQNYNRLKKNYDKCWVMIQDRKVVKSASTFEEIMHTVKKHDPHKILVEYIQSEPIAMFF
ncbi:hypothetical protein KA005_44395 [bacterium]|nr:hypothetical protein [bacterium]